VKRLVRSPAAPTPFHLSVAAQRLRTVFRRVPQWVWLVETRRSPCPARLVPNTPPQLFLPPATLGPPSPSFVTPLPLPLIFSPPCALNPPFLCFPSAGHLGEQGNSLGRYPFLPAFRGRVVNQSSRTSPLLCFPLFYAFEESPFGPSEGFLGLCVLTPWFITKFLFFCPLFV